MAVDTRALQRILIVVLATLAAILGGGLLLPKGWQVERQLVIAAPPAAVFGQVNSLKRWREWAVGHEAESHPAEYSGPESGPGATRRWQSDGGRAVLKIMDTVRDRKLDYEQMVDGGAWVITGTIRLQPENSGTRVVWRAGGSGGGNPLDRYLALFTRYPVGQDFDASLARLKARLEAAP
jgi:hypothetical protein